MRLCETAVWEWDNIPLLRQSGMRPMLYAMNHELLLVLVNCYTCTASTKMTPPPPPHTHTQTHKQTNKHTHTHTQGGKKVVCGDGEGALMLYNWGLWGDITDRYPCRPHSIDSMIPISDTVLCIGSMDGAIRSVSCRNSVNSQEILAGSTFLINPLSTDFGVIIRARIHNQLIDEKKWHSKAFFLAGMKVKYINVCSM